MQDQLLWLDTTVGLGSGRSHCHLLLHLPSQGTSTGTPHHILCFLSSLPLHFSLFYPLLLFLSLIKSQRDIQRAAPRWCQHLVVSTLRARWKDDGLVLVRCSCLSHPYAHGANGQGHSLRIGECRKWVSFAKKSSWVLTELPGQCRHSLWPQELNRGTQLTASRDVSAHGSIYIHSFF